MAPKTKNTGKSGSASDREDRLKAALKANMAKRKAQARARATSPEGDDPSGPDQIPPSPGAPDTGKHEG